MTYAERMQKAAEVAIEKFRRGEKPAELSPVPTGRVRKTKAQGSGELYERPKFGERIPDGCSFCGATEFESKHRLTLKNCIFCSNSKSDTFLEEWA